MIEGSEYIEKIKHYFNFLIAEFGYKISDQKIRGNSFYDVQYRDELRVVSVSYENIEDYFLVIIFILENGELPHFDDKRRAAFK